MDYKKIIGILIAVFVVIFVAGTTMSSPVHQKNNSIISITSGDEISEGGNLSIALTDNNTRPIANQTVHITIIYENGTTSQREVTTDAYGNAVVDLNGVPSGQYMINATYGGNDDYLAASASKNLTIKEKTADSTSSANNQQTTHPSGLTDEQIEANIQRDVNVRASNGVHDGYNYDEARKFYANVPPEGMK